MRDYLIGYIAADEDLVKLGYHENEKFINDVIEEYESNLKYVEDGYSEIDAKDDAIRTVADRWVEMNRIDEIIYKETQKAAYEEQCEQGFVHQEQPNEDYFEGLNDYFDGTMSI